MSITERIKKNFKVIATTDESALESNRLKVIAWCRKEADILEERGSFERKRGASFKRSGKTMQGFLESRGWKEEKGKVKIVLRAGRRLACLSVGDNGEPMQLYFDEPNVERVVSFFRELANILSEDKTIDIYVKDSETEEYTTTLTTDKPTKVISKKMPEKICKVSWCNSLVEGYDDRVCYCTVHKQYKDYGKNASRRPWLFYKVEKVVRGELKCECCGYDPKKTYPDRNLKILVTLLDVDHINSNLKGTEEGEQPSNYQLLCKHCHILKSVDEGDYLKKVYR